MERKYSISEIDAMRSSIDRSLPIGGGSNTAQRAAQVEDRLRTYMQNGSSPEELEQMALSAMEHWRNEARFVAEMNAAIAAKRAKRGPKPQP